VSTVSTQEEVSPTRRTSLTVPVLLAVAAGIDAIAWVLAAAGALPPVPFLDVYILVSTLFVLGWGVTWLARRQAARLLAEGAAEPPLLTGRHLTATRLSWLVLFSAIAVLYAVALAVIWREANDVYFQQPYDEIVASGSLGLTYNEQALLGSFGETPGWYPWLVVVRAALVLTAALAIGWSVFARRPRHWMGYFVAGLVALGPLGHLDSVRSSESPLDEFAVVLSVVLALGTTGFLWVFPDGRFRRTFLRYVAVLTVGWIAALIIEWLSGGEFGDVLWILGVTTAFLLVSGGVATQVWRYRHVPLSSKRLARWNLAILVAIPAWILMYPWVYQRFDRGESMVAFVWQQVHLTIYLAGPVLLGLWVLYLMRNQGWWDAQRFWRRTTVLVVLAPLFVGAYLGVLVAVSVTAQAITGGKSQALAVLVATAAVAFAFRPVQRIVAGWVDRRFFPSRQLADETVTRFTERVRQEPDPVRVRDELIAVVHDTLGPEHAVVRTVGREVR
jgi:hypothetical protein